MSAVRALERHMTLAVTLVYSGIPHMTRAVTLVCRGIQHMTSRHIALIYHIAVPHVTVMGGGQERGEGVTRVHDSPDATCRMPHAP
jgi:hypothetical protein